MSFGTSLFRSFVRYFLRPVVISFVISVLLSFVIPLVISVAIVHSFFFNINALRSSFFSSLFLDVFRSFVIV